MSKHMLVLELNCAQCGALLTDGTKVPLEAFVKETGREGEMRLSAVFGDYSVETDLAVSPGNIVEFRCPKCEACLLYTSPSPRDRTRSRMPSSA